MSPEAWMGLVPVRLRRRSEETTVALELRPGGARAFEVRLAEPMIAHGIESFATWAGLAGSLVGKGDDHHHHVVEDAALVLGRGLHRSLGERPRVRIASATVPMDDALVSVALDLSGRPYSAVDAAYPALVRHFFRSLADEAKWTCHVRRIDGEDEHHLIEAAFKALGLAFARAAQPVARPRSRKGPVRWEEGGDW